MSARPGELQWGGLGRGLRCRSRVLRGRDGCDGTMTVLTVFRSVSPLRKPEQRTAAEGVGAEATVHWANIITSKERMKRLQ